VVVGGAFLAALPLLMRRFGLEGAGAGLVAAEIGLGVGFLLMLMRHGRERLRGNPALPPDDAALLSTEPALD
jgi:hypothetical protein